MSQILGLYNYWVVICLMMIGFYIVIAQGNLVKKVIGLNIFQISVFLLYITMGKVEKGTAPIKPAYEFKTGTVEEFATFSNPLPSVLMLTAIVVGVATTSLALALIVRIREAYGTIEEDEILAADQESQC